MQTDLQEKFQALGPCVTRDAEGENLRVHLLIGDKAPGGGGGPDKRREKGGFEELGGDDCEEKDYWGQGNIVGNRYCRVGKSASG